MCSEMFDMNLRFLIGIVSLKLVSWWMIFCVVILIFMCVSVSLM